MKTANSKIPLLGIRRPLIQAPMAGSAGSALAIAVAHAGALGSIACATLSAKDIEREVATFSANVDAPVNLNFFCHRDVPLLEEVSSWWIERLRPYYEEFGVDVTDGGSTRRPFDSDTADVVGFLKPAFTSFHFGLPEDALLERVRQTGCYVMSSATTVEEARWLESRGVDAIIVQGLEAGGHRGHFLRDDLEGQAPLLDLLAAVREQVSVPLVAAGGISDHRRVQAAFDAGASAVQVGTAFLRCPEADTNDVHRAALAAHKGDDTAITNIFSGRPARGIVNRVMREIGPMAGEAPPFPFAAAGIAPLRRAAESEGRGDFSPLWSGTGGAPFEMPAADVIDALFTPVVSAKRQ